MKIKFVADELQTINRPPPRYQIESYLKAIFNQTKIAEALGVHKSTISRELKRNSKKHSYSAQFAITLSEERKKAYKYSIFDVNMKQYIENKLIRHQWSP